MIGWSAGDAPPVPGAGAGRRCPGNELNDWTAVVFPPHARDLSGHQFSLKFKDGPAWGLAEESVGLATFCV